MRRWKKWEAETASLEYQFANGTVHFFPFFLNLIMPLQTYARTHHPSRELTDVLYHWLDCRSFAVPFHAPDVLRQAPHGPLQRYRRQMDREFLHHLALSFTCTDLPLVIYIHLVLVSGCLLQAVLHVSHQGGLPNLAHGLHQRTY
jgi:hypothetical protein